MLKPKLVLDFGCETTSMLLPHASGTFWEFSSLNHTEDTIYIIGRREFSRHRDLIRELVDKGIRIIFSNPFEGSDTLRMQIEGIGMADLFFEKKMLLIGGGDMAPEWPYLLHEHFLNKVHSFYENLRDISKSDEIFSKLEKPYTFLFLNGRGRAHRKWMIERLDSLGLLDKSLYSWLDSSSLAKRGLSLMIDGENLMSKSRDLHLLPEQYEIDRYRSRLKVPVETSFAKYNLFNNEWGEIYINADQYIDTYFSLVTETIYEYPYSFRTEKIWKPVAMSHPWICVSNRGFYKDMRNLGFQTFDNLIDESFDLIDNDADRFEKIARVVEDLCSQDLDKFLSAAKDTCKYNQQHLLEIKDTANNSFPDRFFQFLQKYQWMT